MLPAPAAPLLPRLYPLPGRIWQVQAGRRGLGVELRDVAARQVGYAWLPLRGRPRLLPTEDWWRGLRAVGHSCLYTHGYAHPGSPTQRHLAAYACRTGKKLWEQPELQLRSLSATGLWCADGQGQAVHLHPGTGRPRRPDPNPYPLPEQHFPGTAVYTDALWPQLVARVRPWLDYEPALQLEYLSWGPYEIWCALRAGQAEQGTQPAHYTAELLVLHAGAELQRATLYQGREKIGIDSFFVWQHHLVYVQDDRALALLPLSRW
ncbi:MAG: DUF4905 domain-containing protein [Sphingobacteriia bacterium]